MALMSRMHMNGDDGYNEFTSLDPKIVIIDIMMPGSDGFSAVKKIRAVNKDVPIIMLTAKPLTEDLVKAFDLGCNDFIRKPFVMEELIARIKSFAKVSGNASQCCTEYLSNWVALPLTHPHMNWQMIRTGFNFLIKKWNC